jgi:hypothetical protein
LLKFLRFGWPRRPVQLNWRRRRANSISRGRNMDDGKPDIIAGIRELRAKAAEQLTGNEYYMIVQQLDSLAESAELSGDAARSVFSLISARLEGGAAAASVPGGPEIPPAPDTPAQPDAPSTPEQPVVPDSPAQPDIAPGPDIPSPPDSPAEQPTPPEMPASTAAAGAPEPVQIFTPSANSFGTPQATVAIRHAEPGETDAAPPAQEAAPQSQAAGGLILAVLAARTLIEERLSGNSYYAAANLLAQLQLMPPVAGSGETATPEGFVGALALLRREAAHLPDATREEAAQIIAALENVLLPQAEPLTERPAAPEPLAPEPDPGPRTGFDDLAEAAWRRVQQVSAADARRAAALNGSTPPAPAPEATAPAPAPVADAPAEMMQQDNGEAFDDGGSESRSSEPCYRHEFEPADGRLGASDRQEPAAEAGPGAPSEAEREAAVSAEAAALIPLTDSSPVAPTTAEAPPVAPVFDAEPQQAVPLEETNVAAVGPQPAETEYVALLDERATGKAEPAVAEAPAPPASGETPPVQASPPKPARRGLFGRLLGGETSRRP